MSVSCTHIQRLKRGHVNPCSAFGSWAIIRTIFPAILANLYTHLGKRVFMLFTYICEQIPLIDRIRDVPQLAHACQRWLNGDQNGVIMFYLFQSVSPCSIMYHLDPFVMLYLNSRIHAHYICLHQLSNSWGQPSPCFFIFMSTLVWVLWVEGRGNGV